MSCRWLARRAGLRPRRGSLGPRRGSGVQAVQADRVSSGVFAQAHADIHAHRAAVWHGGYGGHGGHGGAREGWHDGMRGGQIACLFARHPRPCACRQVVAPGPPRSGGACVLGGAAQPHRSPLQPGRTMILSRAVLRAVASAAAAAAGRAVPGVAAAGHLAWATGWVLAARQAWGPSRHAAAMAALPQRGPAAPGSLVGRPAAAPSPAGGWRTYVSRRPLLQTPQVGGWLARGDLPHGSNSKRAPGAGRRAPGTGRATSCRDDAGGTQGRRRGELHPPPPCSTVGLMHPYQSNWPGGTSHAQTA